VILNQKKEKSLFKILFKIKKESVGNDRTEDIKEKNNDLFLIKGEGYKKKGKELKY
jgi:hypothetical protein